MRKISILENEKLNLKILTALRPVIEKKVLDLVLEDRESEFFIGGGMNLDVLFGQALFNLKETHPYIKYKVVLCQAPDSYEWKVTFRKILKNGDGTVMILPGGKLDPEKKRENYLRKTADVIIGYGVNKQGRREWKKIIDLKEMLESGMGNFNESGGSAYRIK